MESKLRQTISSLVNIVPPEIKEALTYVEKVSPVETNIPLSGGIVVEALYKGIQVEGERKKDLAIYSDPYGGRVGVSMVTPVNLVTWKCQCVERRGEYAYRLSCTVRIPNRRSLDDTPVYTVAVGMTAFISSHLGQAMLTLGSKKASIKSIKPPMPVSMLRTSILKLAGVTNETVSGHELWKGRIGSAMVAATLLRPTNKEWKVLRIDNDLRAIRADGGTECLWIVLRDSSVGVVLQREKIEEIGMVSFLSYSLAGIGTFTVCGDNFPLPDNSVRIACEHFCQVTENWYTNWREIAIEVSYCPPDSGNQQNCS